jgi:hypothetical protein
MESLKNPDRRNKVGFSTFMSDVFTADVVLYKKVNQKVEDYDLCCDKEVDVADVGQAITNLNTPSQFSVCGVDPGRTHVFIVAYGSRDQLHQVRRCSTKEYYHMTGSNRRAKKDRQRKEQEGLTEIFLTISTYKTASLSTYLNYVNYILLIIYAKYYTSIINVLRKRDYIHTKVYKEQRKKW